MSRLVVFGSLLALAGEALANGRNPGTSTINFEPGNESHILAGMTFGTMISKDNGATWTWQCEDAVGYGGTYDPDYAFTPTGALFATTFDGLKVNRDGCVYAGSVLSPDGADPIRFFSTVAVHDDGAIYAASVDQNDGKIYKSTDDGVTFPLAVLPPGVVPLNTWWSALEVAPSSSQIVYAANYRSVNQSREFKMFKSVDGGASYTELPIDDIQRTGNSTLEIVGIGRTDPNLVYLRVTLWEDLIGDAIYRTTDGGQNWVRILELEAQIAFVLRRSGELVAGTQVMGAFRSTNQGADWTPLAGAPKINCLAESSAGEVWACTQNYGTPMLPGDEFGIMKSTDLASWTGVMKYQDIREPDPCPDGTVQKDKCDAELWCGLCAQLGCNANRNCELTGDGTGGTDTVLKVPETGCCQTGSEGVAGLMAIAGAVGMVLARRRR